MQKDKVISDQLLRKVAGTFPTGVTVVTTHNEDDAIHGATIGSFLSISLSPPLVGFCIKKEATLFSHLSIGKKVGISILTEDQQTISNQFAGRNEQSIKIDFEPKNGVNIIKEAHAWYSTQIEQIIPIGDHYLIVCLVQNLDHRKASPLVYYSGYKKIATTTL